MICSKKTASRLFPVFTTHAFMSCCVVIIEKLFASVVRRQPADKSHFTIATLLLINKAEREVIKDRKRLVIYGGP